MDAIRILRSRTVVIDRDNIDTDQIIPARYLKVTKREGLGQGLFANWRYLQNGEPDPNFVLNRPETKGCQILVAGNNIGCGSSREHAAWALTDFGFRAVVSHVIADIFQNNATKNGLIPVQIDQETHQRLLAEPGIEMTIDLEATEIELPDRSRRKFTIDPFARHCLMNGLDEMGYLLNHEAAICRFEQQRGHHE